ncbi:MAG: hypothetical protein ACD_4C00384G0003 [uncultured bacterium (gcode 4)]|uniref:Uncharacterized protein n=1 Tax=uncultured bacterium (gcode 4) TaxID=1234023 RepID=K2FWF8_9BACT|nr:MAG: hypothetical protein ACD_4C00384G0003 [uncultured bacterium (gcode 4)]
MSESIGHNQIIDIRKSYENRELEISKKKTSWTEVKDSLISSYKHSKELQKNLYWLAWDKQDLDMIDSLDKDFQSRLKKQAEKHQSNESVTKWRYNESLSKLWVTYEQFEAEHNKVQNLKLNSSINENIMNLDHSLETPILEPLDIILILATFKTTLWKLWLKGLSKWCSLIFEKTWEILIKTETWTKVLEAKWIWEKAIQRILEKYKDKIQWAKELFEPHWITTEWVKIKTSNVEELWKPTIIKSEITKEAANKWVEHTNELFNFLTNRMVFKNSDWSLIYTKDFVQRIKELSENLKPSELLT